MDENPYKAPSELSVDQAAQPVANPWENLGPDEKALAIAVFFIAGAALITIAQCLIQAAWTWS